MKTYKFFYFDSFEGAKKGDIKEYVIYAPRFDSAFKSFARFISFHESSYIDFLYTYNVSNDFKTQVRTITYNDIFYLVSVKDKHNAKFWETYHGS